MNVYDIIKESYNTDNEIIEEGLFRKNSKNNTPTIKVLDNDSDKKHFYEFVSNFKKYLDSSYKGDLISIELNGNDSDIINFEVENEKFDDNKEYQKVEKDMLSILKKVYSYNCLSKTGKVDYMFDMVVEYKGLLINIHNKFERFYLSFDPIYSKSMEKDTIYKYKDIKKLVSINNFDGTELLNYKDKFEIHVPRTDIDFYKSKINNIFKNYDITIEEEKERLTTGFIKQLTVKFNSINESYYDENELHKSNLIKEENTMTINVLANLAKNAGLENLLIESDIVEESNKIIDSLDTIDESVLTGDISVLPVYESDKSYYTDLDSLYTVAEVYDVELDKAMSLLKEVNNISEDENISVILKEGFEKVITLESFIDMKKALDEAGIAISLDKEVSIDDFITEANVISDAFSKVKDKIKNMNINSLQKTIKKCEESNKKLNEEMQKLDKMSKEEASKYVEKQANKNLAVVSAYLGTSMVSGWATGVLIVAKPLVGIPVYAGLLKSVNSVGAKLNRSGKTIITSNVDKYKKAINNTIKINNKTIKECNNIIKAKK